MDFFLYKDDKEIKSGEDVAYKYLAGKVADKIHPPAQIKHRKEFKFIRINFEIY